MVVAVGFEPPIIKQYCASVLLTRLFLRGKMEKIIKRADAYNSGNRQNAADNPKNNLPCIVCNKESD